MDERFLNELADRFATRAAARNLLEAAGYKVSDLPAWDAADSPLQYWRAVLRELESGKGDAGSLVGAALTHYPENGAFLMAAIRPAGGESVKIWPGPGHFRTDLRLDTLYEQREDAEGEQRKALDAEILDIRRRLRDRVLQPNEWLGDGRFKLKKLLGLGGFGEVWLAYDKKERRKVALKILHSQYARDATRRQRFLRGARQMAKLDHPGIVRVLGESHNGEDCFFAMEHVPGGDLRQAVCQKKITTVEALERVLEVGEALAYAHECGVVHRDVKPANILLTEDGRAKLTDFDLVRAADTTGGTRTQAMGSFIYAAPEMMESAKEAGEPADVYGLAMTACFVFHGEDLPSRALWATESFLADLDISPRARRVLMVGLEKEASERTRSIVAFCEAFQRALHPPQPNPGKALAHYLLSPQVTPTLPPTTAARYRPTDPEELFSSLETPHDGRVPLWCEIPAGKFLMGSPEDEAGRYGRETEHTVTISQPFQMMAVPVTNAMYQAFDPGFEPRPWVGIVTADLDLFPVVAVSWENDVERFVSWLAEQHLPGVRLPTEAEWEYACRAGTSTRYWSGNEEDDLGRVAWYRANAGRRPHRVGEKLANPWGLYDMHGNVGEWCADWYGAYSTEPTADPAGPEMGEGRVGRGGSWDVTARNVRAACRDYWRPSDRRGSLGFRLVRDQAPKPRRAR